MLVILKGTWSILPGGALVVADEQVPISSEPVYSGEPGQSSLIYDTDVILEKTGTDCVLIGHAWALRSGEPHVDVTFAVGPVKRHARVFGERRWSRTGAGAATIARIAPIDKIPLTWENAFGGADTTPQDPADHQFCAENPVGRGMIADRTTIDVNGLLLPNIEDPADLIGVPGQRPRPVGFGMVAPYWQPRAGYAGTCDEEWRKTVCPLPPIDQDPRFNSLAAPGLCTPQHLAGAEQVLVEGASQAGTLSFSLPDITPHASARFRHRDDGLDMKLDTVIVEPDDARLILIWRGVLNVHGRVHEIRHLHVGL